MGAVPPAPLARLEKPDLTPSKELSAYRWVVGNVPCSKGPVPRETAEKVVRELRMRGLDAAQTKTVLMALQASGYELVPQTGVRPPDGSGDGRGTQRMSAVGPGDVADPRAVADSIRTSHEWARISGDTGHMKELEKEFQALVEGVKFEEARNGTEWQHGNRLTQSDPEADHVRNADGSRPVGVDRTPISGAYRSPGDGLLYNLGPEPGEAGGEAGEAD